MQEDAELARQVYAASTRGAGEVMRRVTLVRQEALEAAAAAGCAGGSGLKAPGADALTRAASAPPAEVLAGARERSPGPAVHGAPDGSEGPRSSAGAPPAQAGQAGGAEERDGRREPAGATQPGDGSAGGGPGRERGKEKKRKRRAAEAAAAGAHASRVERGAGAADPAPESVLAPVGGVSRTSGGVTGAAPAAGDGGSSDVMATASAGRDMSSYTVAAAGSAGAAGAQPALTGIADGHGVPAKARVSGPDKRAADGKERSAMKDKKAKKRRYSHAERVA